MASPLQVQRDRHRTAVKRNITNAERMTRENRRSDVEANLKDAYESYDAMEKANWDYVASLDATHESYKGLCEAADNWMKEIEQVYQPKLSAVITYLQGPASKVPQSNNSNSTSSSSSSSGSTPTSGASAIDLGREIATVLSLPKLECPTFSGDPREWSVFKNMFDTTIGDKLAENGAKHTHLISLLRGEARESVKHTLLFESDDAYDEAVKVLEDRYGNDQIITKCIMSDLRGGKSVRSQKEIQQFVDELGAADKVISKMKTYNEINTVDFIKDMLVRCSHAIIMKWKKKATAHLAEQAKYPDFKAFIVFMKSIALQESDPAFGLEGTKEILARSKARELETKSGKVAVNNVNSTPAPRKASTSGPRPKPKCKACGAEHYLNKCPSFKAKSVDERQAFVNSNRLCIRCLGPHEFSTCKHAWKCCVDNCQAPHSYLLHKHASVNVAMVNSHSSEICLPVVRVRVNGVETHALLDSGSTHSFVKESFAKQLGLPVTHRRRDLSTVLGSRSQNLKHVNFTISPVDSDVKYCMTSCMVLSDIPANPRRSEVDLRAHPHLQGLPLDQCSADQVTVLVGQDHGHLLSARDRRLPEGTGVGQPYAILTLLGWTVQGTLNGGRGDSDFKVSTNLVSADGLEHDLGKLWDIEREDETETGWSADDRKVHEMWQNKITVSGGHYVLPIPFRDAKASFPNNRRYALHRLESTERKLKKDDMMEAYKEQLDSLLQDGYAERVPEDKLARDDGKVFYLPHFPVTRADKPGKVRLVHDCAAVFQGVSLNRMCFQGPDLNNKLQNIVVRFREYEYAFTCDVSAMYLQVRIPEEERDVLRFLWRDDEGHVIELRMTSHLFGGVWCAASSTFALRRAVEDARASADVMHAVERNTYVDDLLQSMRELTAATRLARDVKEALAPAHFVMSKYVSSHPEVLAEVPTESKSTPVKNMPSQENSKALGLRWDIKKDAFYYERVGSWSGKDISKRQVLSLVSSLYDPLGLLAPIIVVGRMIFQQITKLKLGWDDVIPSDVTQEWNEWWTSLEDLQEIKFPRSLVGELYRGAECELHHFSDASEKAYGMVSYLRVRRPQEAVRVTLVLAKARVAPLKLVTMPRLELCAAVLAVKMDVVLRKEMTLKLGRSLFWCDSQIVLCYIRNSALRLKTYVANRVTYIQEHSRAEDWRYVNTTVNIADIVSRGCALKDLPHEWINGPTFLCRPESEWPVEREVSEVIDLEVKNANIKVQEDVTKQETSGKYENPVDVMAKYHSSAKRLYVSMAWLLRLSGYARGENVKGDLSVGELKRAEEAIVRSVQSREYHQEIADVKKHGQVSCSSQLRSLCPVMKNGILVVGGRLTHAPISHSARTPAILPRKHPYSELVMKNEHARAHLGCEWTLSRLREKYWIPGARSSLKKIRRTCMTCQKYFGKPEAQLMADLPRERCETGNVAFRHVGLDLFGNFYVQVGRAQVKRYGVLFTCFATRAVHLEVVYSLDTESFLMALSRFCSRRGYPETVKSDQGKNIVGAVGEIRRAWMEVDHGKVQRSLRDKGIQWSFNPPKASAMGGVWERMIRTVRKVLLGVLNPHTKLNDELLQTVFCQVENLVNSRPVTRVSQDPEDGALTPNHVLILTSNAPEDAAQLCTGTALRGKVKRLRAYLDSFWDKWSREYLLEQQRRTVWDRSRKDFRVGELVVVQENGVAQGRWPLAIVTEVVRGRDSRVRSLHLRAKGSTYHRPVCKVVKLELE